MNNAEMFVQTFGIYATELWAMPEKEFLEWLNSARPVKHGKWINDKGLYRCTACNNLLTVAGWDIPEEQIYKSFKFCTNCGAKMERSEE